MKIIIKLDIRSCNECPYYKWEVDNSESNHCGVSVCKTMSRQITWDDKSPKIPRWCPLKAKK